MRIVSDNTRFNHKPFRGRGASLYAGVGDGPDAVQFRRFRIFGSDIVRRPTLSFANGFLKCQFLAQVTDPNHEFNYTFPEAWKDSTVWVQVRTFWDHCENVHNLNPLRLEFTAGGDIDTQIHAAGNIIRADKLDGGIYRVAAAYYPGTDGTPATTLLLRQTAGPGSLADVELDIDTDQRLYLFLTAALTNGESYSFALVAQADAIELQLDSITFVADAVGPPTPTSVALRAT